MTLSEKTPRRAIYLLDRKAVLLSLVVVSVVVCWTQFLGRTEPLTAKAPSRNAGRGGDPIPRRELKTSEPTPNDTEATDSGDITPEPVSENDDLMRGEVAVPSQGIVSR
jgi:hypothetical protein